MTDILMKNNRLVMKNGDYVLVTGIEEIKQHIIVALNTFYEDWRPDATKGIDYVYGLRNNEFLEYDVKKQISNVQGVQSIDDFSLTFDRKTQTVNILARIKTDYGNIVFNEEIQTGV